MRAALRLRRRCRLRRQPALLPARPQQRICQARRPRQGIKEAHERNKKFFLTVNTLPHNSKLKTFVSDMEPLIAMKPDALIMADPGLIMTVREKWPEMPIHLSVQANTTNYWGVKFWQNTASNALFCRAN